MALALAACQPSPKDANSATGKDSPIVAPHRASLDPEDIGIFKYVFEVPIQPPGKVMVLRWTKYVPGQPPEVRETIEANSYRPLCQVVMIYNSSLFPFNPDPSKPSMILVRARGEDHHLPPGLDCTVVQSADEPLAFHFSNKERWVYQCFVEDYKTVSERIPNLPPAPKNGGWAFNSQVLPNGP